MKPEECALSESYPDERSRNIEVEFDLPEDCRVKIAVQDTLGVEVFTLVDNDLVAGRYQRVWTCRDSTGRTVTPGRYVLRMNVKPLKTADKLVSLERVVTVR